MPKPSTRHAPQTWPMAHQDPGTATSVAGDVGTQGGAPPCSIVGPRTFVFVYTPLRAPAAGMPTTVCRQPSAVNRQPSAASRRPLAASRQPPAVHDLMGLALCGIFKLACGCCKAWSLYLDASHRSVQHDVVFTRRQSRDKVLMHKN